jgi:hypothetical protein
MRSSIAVLALLLLTLTVASAGIEAIAGCLELCPDETAEQDVCSSDACCSCCIHAGSLFAALALPAYRLDRIGAAPPAHVVSVPPAHSSRILHVPKPLPT